MTSEQYEYLKGRDRAASEVTHTARRLQLRNRQLEEQLEATQVILRGFLHDADQGDLSGVGLRDMARAVLNPASEPS